MKIANDLTQFADVVCTSIQNGLNNTEVGKELTDRLLAEKLKENPNMTAEEWSKTKQQFMVYCFSMMMNEKPELMNELAEHIWNELKNE